MPRRSAAAVADSRAIAVAAAVDLASVEGLEGITIGRLAGDLAMSKSGLIGRFGDKEALQRAVLASAIKRFTAAVWEPASVAEPGLPRLEAIIDAWIEHLRAGVFPGGCFVTTASVEYDARPGTLHDDAAAAVRRWLAVLEAEARRALDAGDLPAGRDAADVALELHALASGGSVAGRLLDDRAAPIARAPRCAARPGWRTTAAGIRAGAAAPSGRCAASAPSGRSPWRAPRRRASAPARGRCRAPSAARRRCAPR